jgi:pimeloyl-ACP methyl ester carboxylesterase
MFINGISIRYEILGDRNNNWVSLNPGGHRPLESVRPLGEHLANAGFSVLLHDRRNCGYSDIAFDSGVSEQELWVEDLYAITQKLEITELIAGGGSAGCRLSLLLALRNPGLVSGLLLWMPTGGHTAAEVLGEFYYGQFIQPARDGGMAAVSTAEFYRKRLNLNPSNHTTLMAIDPEEFIATMEVWRDYFYQGADLAVMGVTDDELAGLNIPTCIVPGSDPIHPVQVAIQLADVLPDARLRYPFEKSEREHLKTCSIDVVREAFQAKLPSIFLPFLEETFTAGQSA